jgi:serine/threonine-protein kinase
VEDPNDIAGPTLSENPRGLRATRPPSAPHALSPETDSALTQHQNSTLFGSAVTPNTEMTARAAEEASEVGRMRVMALSQIALVILGMCCAIVFTAPLWIKSLAVVSLTLLLAAFVGVWVRLRRDGQLKADYVQFLTIPISLTIVAGNFAFGLSSAFSAAVTLGLVLYASSVGRHQAMVSWGTIAVGQLGAGYAAYALGDAYQPLFPGVFGPGWHHAAGVVALELLYLSAVVAGRLIRREHAHVVSQFERAVRDAALREGVLREAREALRHAAGIGVPGRFSDQEVGGYRLGNVIGRGGMGEVYAAHPTQGGDTAAVKLLRLDQLSEESARNRFSREAGIAASIQSDHVVKVLAVSDETSVFPFIVMERLIGTDLASYLRDRVKLPLSEVVDLVDHLAAGLDAAHAMNVVHRDLKPSNIFRTEERAQVVWKVLDFGVSKRMDSTDATLTHAEIVGTPQYMAPEQARGEVLLDQRADIYALAAIAYRALVGEPPFTGQLPAILRRILDDMPRAPSDLAAVPRDVDYALRIGLEKRKDLRFSRASELANALRAASHYRLDEDVRHRARALLEAQPYDS